MLVKCSQIKLEVYVLYHRNKMLFNLPLSPVSELRVIPILRFRKTGYGYIIIS